MPLTILETSDCRNQRWMWRMDDSHPVKSARLHMRFPTSRHSSIRDSDQFKWGRAYRIGQGDKLSKRPFAGPDGTRESTNRAIY